MPRQEFRELNGLRAHLLVWPGPAGAPTVVLLHGFLDLAWSFAPFADALQARLPCEIVALDLRGHGRSEWVGRGGYYHFADDVADVHALVSSLEGPVFLLGHSMGGSIAVLFAGAFPERVQRLVLVEGLGPPPGPVDDPAERLARWIHEVDARRTQPPRPMPSRAFAAKRLQDGYPRLSDKLAALLAEHGTRAVEGGVVWSFDPLHRTRSPLPFVLEQLRAFLRRLACPTLLVEGAESGFRQFIDDGRAAEIRGGQHHAIAGAGHMVHQDQPEALAEAVAGFFAAPS